MQVDGKFMVNGDVPDGQAAVYALLHDCYDLAHQLKDQAVENERKESGEPAPIPVQNAATTASVQSAA